MASDIRKRLEEMEANFSKIQSASEKTTFTSPIRKRRLSNPNVTPCRPLSFALSFDELSPNSAESGRKLKILKKINN